MAIKSHAFGQVKLSDKDAEKFQRQVAYGRPSAAAVKNVQAGASMFRTFQQGGTVTVSVSRKGR